ncbi:MAG: hypothetical protein K2K94_06150 [Muribaculaceae bacterium]|nr:hypothetical protein [Muribaculaceae bacterium]
MNNIRYILALWFLMLSVMTMNGNHVDTPTGYISLDRMHYYVKDYQGNVRQVTDADGKVEQDNHYYPYGMLMGESSDILATARGGSVINPNPYLYGSKEYLTTGGANLLDFTARTYDPSLPLFQTQDPMAGDYTQFNTYLYCGGDPVNRTDDNGKEWTDIEGKPIEDLSKIKRYIFYTDEFRTQAEVQYNDGVEQYGEGTVAMSNTGTSDGFSKDWSDINGQVKDVMIMAHGMNQSINVTNKDGDATNQLTSTGDGMTNGSKTKAVNIQDLDVPKGNINDATLYLYTCHSADNQVSAHGKQFEMAGSKQTVLQAFSKTFDFKYVVGSHSSVNYYNIYLILMEGSLNFSKKQHPYPVNGEWIIQPNPRTGK